MMENHNEEFRDIYDERGIVHKCLTNWCDYYHDALYKRWKHGKCHDYRRDNSVPISVFNCMIWIIMDSYIKNEVANDHDSKNNLLYTMLKILKLLYGETEISSFPYDNTAWKIYFGLAEVWYECDMAVTLEDLVEFYCQHRKRRFDTSVVDFTLGYSDAQDVNLSQMIDIVEFRILFRENVRTLL